ncbi:formylglycine-generating enzyme family protein [Shimia abyssi]|uniref:formylglycine-generating enzyme family protein n=1 Tax=Shimia abyssi TaxID=1662395 RepID=UPI000D0E1B01|nr:formylglycine-generating enzyme family protein [Shimia abyssi]
MNKASHEKQEQLRAHLVPINGGFFEMGARTTRFPIDLDSPRRRLKVPPFLISPTTVSNQEYADFVSHTGYRTVAEQEGWSFVFYLLLQDPNRWQESPPGLPWWRKVDGAYWGCPEGPDSNTEDRLDHPATHLCWYDAVAYCLWAGLRLPYEAEWEYAARGGLTNKKFPWGSTMHTAENFLMNTWQGDFPVENTAEDGYVGTAPVTSFPPNGFGLFNMTGNVWEWVDASHGELPRQFIRPDQPFASALDQQPKVQRGGSYLCHESYCDRYHVHSRSCNDMDSSTGNCGFRTAADLETTTKS